MKQSSTLFSLVAALPVAQAIAFGGPAPTATSPERGLDGTNSKPTKGPSVSELRKRQSNLFPETCGWVDGDYSSGITCNAGRTCMLYTSASFGMAGCCDGLDTQDCGWSHQCVDYSAYTAGSCDTNCMLNSFVRKCTDILSPYCVTWTYPSDGIADYGCAATSSQTIYTVLQSGTDGLGDTTSMALPTVSGNAVTGFEDTTASAAPTYVPSGGGGGSSSSSTHRTGKIAIGLIIGVVIAILFVLFLIIIGVIVIIKRKKKQAQLTANAQAVATAQANAQSAYPKPQQQQPQMHMQQPMQGGFVPPPNPQQGGFAAPMPPQSPQPTSNGYFPPPGQSEQKYNPHTSVYEYAVTPISNPPTPAPAYSQPFGSPVVPPMPTPMSVQAHYHTPADGAHEVDSNGVSRPPPPQVASPSGQYPRPVVGAHEVDASSAPRPPQQSGPVYEMGQGR
ncbi:Nn.00g110300.m01.CDS01 [Neocucurbitaria sp. VM-36]